MSIQKPEQVEIGGNLIQYVRQQNGGTMKRRSLCWLAAFLMLLSLCAGFLGAQTSDSVFVSFSSVAGVHPLTSVGGMLHGDDCDSVRVVGLTFTWHSHFPAYQVPNLDWSAGRGEDVSQNFPLPPAAPGFPEDAHLVYVVYPDGSTQTLDIDPLVPGRPYQLAPGCSPTPIQLSSFTGILINNRVRLDWTTVSELNNYGFFVQKKRTGEVRWNEIPNSFIAGHGTTSIPHHYTFTDDAVVTTMVQYRLEQRDLNGAIHYTEPIQIEIPTDVKGIVPGEFALQQNYPNPFNPTTEIRYQTPEVVHVTLKLFDVLGREVATLVNEVKQAGTYTVLFDASNLTGGVYFYRMQAGDFVKTKKLLLLK